METASNEAEGKSTLAAKSWQHVAMKMARMTVSKLYHSLTIRTILVSVRVLVIDSYLL